MPKTDTSKLPETFDHLRSRKKPVTGKCEICGDTELAQEFSELTAQVADMEVLSVAKPADTDLTQRLVAKRAELDQLRDRLRPTIITFKFQAIGRKSYDRLIEKYPPTEVQIEKYEAEKQKARDKGDEVPDADLEWDMDLFPPAIVAASSYDPQITLEEALEMFDDDPQWNGTELASIYGEALRVNQVRYVIDLGKG